MILLYILTLWNFSFKNNTDGRKLNSVTDASATVTNYVYDVDGTRRNKTVGGVAHYYIWEDGRPLKEYVAGKTDIYNAADTMYFFYDQDGAPYALMYNNVTYYYILNVQGDVIRLVDNSGATVASYIYDPYGNMVSATGAMAQKNPLRYRGYYYDQETGFYYLNARYYDPKTGRFLNADAVECLGVNGDMSSYNLFAYCGNNPVNRSDTSGTLWITIGAMLVGAAVGVVTQYACDVTINMLSGKSFTEALTYTSTWADYGAAALSGAIAATGIGMGATVAANATIGGVTYLTNCSIKGEEANTVDLLASAAIGGVSGAIGGKGADVANRAAVINTSKNILQTAVSPKKIAMYTSKILSNKMGIIDGIKGILKAGGAGNVINAIRRRITGSDT